MRRKVTHNRRLQGKEFIFSCCDYSWLLLPWIPWSVASPSGYCASVTDSTCTGCVSQFRNNSANAIGPMSKDKMLRLLKTEINSKQLRISKNMASGLSSWSMGVLKSIGRIVTLSGKDSVIIPSNKPEAPSVVVPSKVPEELCVVAPPTEPEVSTDRPAFPAQGIVFSDTENDIDSVRNTLRFAGIINGKGELTDNLEGISIFHTGDLLHKKNPDPSAVDFWQSLQQDALTKGCHVKLIAGNHEQEIWQKIRAGETFGLGAQKALRLNKFIEGLDLFYVTGPVLFMHGYPTLEFLRTLLHFKETTGKDLNCFNRNHYKKAFRSVNAVRQYAYVREDRQTNYLLYDVADASRYYRKQGRVVSTVLAQLKINVVVHGHRPQRSGVQVDYEFGKWIPNVRIIGNDTRVRRRGIGATVISATSCGTLDMVFINTKTASKKLRKKVRKDIRWAVASTGANCITGREDADIRFIAQGYSLRI